MSNIFFNSHLGDENIYYISTFIDALELKINELSEKEKVNIYFICTGGRNDFTDCLIDILNENQKKITLIATGPIYSNGLLIYCEFKGSKKMLSSTTGLAHLSSFEPEMRDLLNVYSLSSIVKYQVENRNKKLTDLFTPLLLTDELERFCNGEDVYLSYERLKKMFRIK